MGWRKIILKDPFIGITDPEKRNRIYDRLKRRGQKDGTWWYKESIYLNYLANSAGLIQKQNKEIKVKDSIYFKR